MTLALPTDPIPAGLRGAAHFVDPAEAIRVRGGLTAAGLLLVEMEAPGPAQRGRLREAIEAAVEDALQRRGAASPGVGAASDLDASLSDQLYRARLVGATGIALQVPPLAGTTNLAGALDAEDSAVLRWWLAAARERPIVVLLADENRSVGAYGPPTRLDALLGEPPRATAEPRAKALLAPAPRAPQEGMLRIAVAAAPGIMAGPAAAGAAAPDVVVAERTQASEWRAYADELHAARGPKPLAAIERLFVTRYVPLADAAARGQVDARGVEVLDEWAASFAKSYTEAFGALRVTGKRPQMVLDVPQLASRIARLHGAKSTQLVVVDAMRFDLGLRVHDRMRAALGGSAACTERVVLWSALPTTTAVQLDLLGKGAEGLANKAPSSEREEPVARGRGVSTVRRVKLGPRDVMKLDCAEARLASAGAGASERLDAVAEEIALALVSHARTLAPRTLMFVFGDHGFRLPASPDGGTAAATQGGASPEEVLVPGFAWIVGGVH